MIDKSKVKFILNKKSIATILIIFILSFMLIVFIDMNINLYPPKLVFIDKESNQLLDGGVLLDEKYIGDSSKGEFRKLPDDFCKKEHDIALDMNGKKYSWKSLPTDCKLNYIVFSVQEQQISKKKEVTMRFFVKESQLAIKGTLFFDNESVAEVNGEHKVDIDKCRSINLIKIKTDERDIEWQHNTQWCDSFDIIDYSIPESEFSVPEEESE
ncbi:MAG: hypothetical protein V1859_03065 [archaeon]